MALLNDVKALIGISHTKKDTAITDTIDTAKAEMARAGIDVEAIVDTDPLISTAIKTYCQYMYDTNDKRREGYFKSWEYQLDNLRKSTGYMVEVE